MFTRTGGRGGIRWNGIWGEQQFQWNGRHAGLEGKGWRGEEGVGREGGDRGGNRSLCLYM